MSKAQAKAAMRLAASKGISLREAWRRVKGGSSMSKKKGGKGKSGGRSGGFYAKAKGFMSGRKVPLTLTYLGSGAAAEIFNLAPTQRQKMFAGIQAMLQAFGISMAVNGYTVGAALVALKGVCALSPWLHSKVNGFLAGFGFYL